MRVGMLMDGQSFGARFNPCEPGVHLLQDWSFGIGLVNPRIELQIGPAIENQGVGGSSELEATQFLPLFHVVPGVDCRDAAGDLTHTYLDHTNASDQWVFSVEDVDVADGKGSQQGLCVHVVVFTALGEIGSGVFQEVGTIELVGLLDGSRVGSVPSVVAPGTQEGLVDGAAHEGLIHDPLDLRTHSVHAEHVVQRVVVVLQPEAVQRLHVADGLGRAGQTVGVGAVHDVLWTFVDGTRSGCQVADEPFVPILEAVEPLIIGIRQEKVFIINAVAGEPPILETIQTRLRFLRVKKGTVDVEDTLEVDVNLGVAEKALPIVVIEQPEEEDGEGHSDDFSVGEDGW